VSKRISPCERLQAQIDEVFAGGGDLAGALEQVAQLGAQLLLQAAIEGEVAAFLGRERYERAVGCEDARPGMRNGHCPTSVKTTAGPVTLDVGQGFVTLCPTSECHSRSIIDLTLELSTQGSRRST
jgi:putative transposase